MFVYIRTEGLLSIKKLMETFADFKPNRKEQTRSVFKIQIQHEITGRIEPRVTIIGGKDELAGDEVIAYHPKETFPNCY